MVCTVAVIASELAARERLTALLAAGPVTVVADGWDAVDVPRADAAVVVCRGADPTPSIVQAGRVLNGGRLVAVLPAATRHAVRRAIRAGAAAVVQEDDAEATLVIAVRAACSGQLSIPLDMAEALEKPVLSSREKQILGMVVMGFTNGEIARRLFLAESTVKSHMSSIFAKLGVCSRKEAAALVLDPEEGLGMGILAISDGAAPGPPPAADRAEAAA